MLREVIACALVAALARHVSSDTSTQTDDNSQSTLLVPIRAAIHALDDSDDSTNTTMATDTSTQTDDNSQSTLLVPIRAAIHALDDSTNTTMATDTSTQTDDNSQSTLLVPIRAAVLALDDSDDSTNTIMATDTTATTDTTTIAIPPQPCVAPGEVTNLVVTPGASSLDVKWTEPSHDADCVDHYSVCWGSNVCGEAKGTQLNIDALYACTEYNVSVTAVGQHGNSTTVTVSQKTLAAAPGNVQNLHVTAEVYSLDVKWSEPTNNKHCVEYYSVCLGSSYCNATNVTELKMDGLAACTEYVIYVVAVGQISNSTSVTSMRTLAAAPSQVENLQVTPETSSLDVKWNEPRDNPACVKSYSVCWGNGCVSTLNTELAIDQLSACTLFSVSVAVVGNGGNSTPVVLNQTTLQAAPGEVGQPQVTAKAFSLNVNWTEPTENKACVESYSVCWGSNVCNNTMHTEMEIDGLHACTEYNISVTAVGKQGNSTPVTTLKSTSAAVPGSIENIVLIEGTTSSLELKWDEPSRNPTCVLSYLVCWQDLSSPGSDGSCSQSDVTSYTIHDLQPCSSYDVSVVANGTEGSSAPVSEVFETQNAVPDVVSNITMVERTTSSLQFTWDEPSENSVCVSNYSVCWQETRSGSSLCSHTDATNFTIESLLPCSSYSIMIKAEGRDGNSSDAVDEQFQTDDAVPENLPQIQMTNSDTTSLNLKWDEPSENPTCVRRYKICWQDISSSHTTDYCNHTPATNYTLQDLQPCSLYKISIEAEGNSGSSSSVSRTVETRDAVPENISSMSLLDSNTTWLQVGWDKPTENPVCVANYSVCWQDTGSGSEMQCTISNITSCIIDSLEPCSSYNISVKANGNNGSSAFIYSVLPTQDAVPGSVLNLDVQPNQTSLEVVWNKPSVNTACASSYKICWSASRAHYESSDHGYGCQDSEQTQISIKNLLPCTWYYVLVEAVGPSSQSNSNSETASATTLLRVPGNVHGLEMVGSSVSSLHYRWSEPTQNPACVVRYHICWQEVNSKSNVCSYPTATNFTIHSLQPCSTYSVSIRAEGKEGFSSHVSSLSETNETEPGPPRNLAGLNVGVQNVTVGWEAPTLHAQCVAQYSLSWVADSKHVSSTNSTHYTILGLQPESSYNISLAAVTKRNLPSQRIYIVIVTNSEPQSNSVVVATTLITVLLITGIAICTVYMYRKGILPWPPWKKSGLRRKSLTHREIPIKDFRSYCDQLLGTPARLQSEYQLLITLCSDLASSMTSTVGHLPDNKKKNRYINIIPYDATRVKLETDDKGTSDYINASYIKGYGGGVEYIAMQGPKEDTCEDFWNLVLQQNVQLIIMLTQFEENEKVKCFRYFPGLRGNVKFGSITVHCATEMMFPIYTQRTFTIYKDSRKKTVKHLHFREWPDFGVPDNTDVMLEFVQVGRQNTESRDYPTVVHCSAGVGRTGTYIAVDILLQHIRESKKVDIFNTVLKLRKDRVNMVQSEAQYAYIYQCIKDALDDDAIMNTEKSSSNHSLEPIYENIGLSLNNSSYEKLAKEQKKGKKPTRHSSHI